MNSINTNDMSNNEYEPFRHACKTDNVKIILRKIYINVLEYLYMTPMTQLKNNLETFAALLGSSFKELTLNKSAPKDYVSFWCGDRTEHYDKGVRSDFIRIFEVKFNKEDSYSMAFSFSYIDLPKDEQTVQFSLKTGGRNDSTVSSDTMTVNEFKTHLNSLNKAMKEKAPLAYNESIEIVCAEFVPHCTLGNLPQQSKPGKKRENTL